MKNLRLYLFMFIALNLVVIAVSYRKNYGDSAYIYFDWDSFNKTVKDNYLIDISVLKEEISNSLTSELIQDSLIHPVFHRYDWKYKHTNFLEKILDSAARNTIDKSFTKKNDKKACFSTTRIILKYLFENHLENHPYNTLPPEFFKPNIDNFFILDGVYCPPRYGYFATELIQSTGIHQDEVIYLLVLEFVLIRINENFILRSEIIP